LAEDVRLLFDRERATVRALQTTDGDDGRIEARAILKHGALNLIKEIPDKASLNIRKSRCLG
jgi:hypothetical protein